MVKMHEINTILALGGNIGATKDFFRKAIQKLENAGFSNIQKSSIIETQPVDCPPNTANFQNMVIIGFWEKGAIELLDIIQDIEISLGRPKEHGINQSRTIDIDIIAMQGVAINSPRLTIPHPRYKEREFVTRPLNELKELGFLKDFLF